MKQSKYNGICRAALMRFLRTALDEMYEPGAIITCGYTPADIIDALNALNRSDDIIERNPDLDFEV